MIWWLVLLFTLTVLASAEVREIPPDPGLGFHWPYFLVVPEKAIQPEFLIVEPNNTGIGSDDQAVHLQAAHKAILRSTSNPAFQKLGMPYLMPVFPRPAKQWQYYTHALDRDTLLWQDPAMKRIDLQLIAMVNDARRRLAEDGIRVARKFFLWGYSAGGSFTIRFTLLHPDLIQAASLGGCSAPPIPLGKIDGELARYPVGVGDLKQLTGTKFRSKDFRKVPIQIFRGAADTNDEVAFDDGYDPRDRDFINRTFGGPPPIQRYPKIQALYERAAPRVKFIIEPGVGHSDKLTRIETPDFFELHRR